MYSVDEGWHYKIYLIRSNDKYSVRRILEGTYAIVLYNPVNVEVKHVAYPKVACVCHLVLLTQIYLYAKTGINKCSVHDVD